MGRTDNQGKPICETCPIRLLSARKKGKIYKHAPGHICHKCYHTKKSRPEEFDEKQRTEDPVTPSKPKRTQSAQFTPENRQTLRDTLKSAGVGVQGRVRSVGYVAQSLMMVDTLRSVGQTLTQAVTVVAAVTCASKQTIFTESKRLIEQNTCHKPADARKNMPDNILLRGCGIKRKRIFSAEMEAMIHRILNHSKENNTYVTSTTLCQSALEELQVIVSRSTMKRWLHVLGYKWGYKKFVKQARSFRDTLIRQYIYKYAQAVREQGDGTAVIVYMDESYVHSHHGVKKGWFHPDAIEGADTQGDIRGKRLIIMHAMTKDGMLHVHDEVPSNILTEIYESAELIFDEVCVDGHSLADYHDTINGDKFVQWIQTRLFPAFTALYPGKKMILVLDNAKYHHHRGPEWFAVSKKKHTELGAFLRACGVKEFTAKESDGSFRVFKKEHFTADSRGKNAKGPTVHQLQIAVKAHIAANPDINTTVPQQLFADKGWELLYTPPYVSDLQPIEMIWGYTKHIVATKNHRKRKIQECAEHTRDAMREVTAGLCQSFINRAHKWIDAFMRGPSGGSLKPFSSLVEFVALGPNKAQDAVLDALQAPLLDSDDEEEEE